MLEGVLCLACVLYGKLLYKKTQVGNKHFPLYPFQYHCILCAFTNETGLRIQGHQNYLLGAFDVVICLKSSERIFTAFLFLVLSALETASQLMEHFIVLASTCLLHFKVPAIVIQEMLENC